MQNKVLIIFIFVHVCIVFVHVQVHMYAEARVRAGARGQLECCLLGLVFIYIFNLCFVLRQSISLFWNSQSRLDWPASDPKKSLPVSKSHGGDYKGRLPHRMMRTKLRSSGIQDKYFTS